MDIAAIKSAVPSPDRVAADLYGIAFRNGVAQCAFPDRHANGDRNHSLRYDRNKGRIYCASQNCFGGKGADSIELVQIMDGSTFTDAVKKLSDHYGLNGTNGHAKHQQPRNGSANHDGEEKVGRESGQPYPADRVRAKLEAEGWRLAAVFTFGESPRKIRLEHQTKTQPDKGGKPDKSFRWEHRGPDGKWYSGDGGQPKPIYTNRPFRERDQLGVVLGVEGEGKADAVAELDIPAFSFRELTPQSAAVLVDLDVCLWPDNDQAGRKLAERVAPVIQKFARSLRIIEPPADFGPGGDVLDALAAGWDEQRIRTLIDSAQPVDSARTAASGEATVTDDWESALIRSENGKPKALLANAITILRLHPAWKDCLAFNEFSLSTSIVKPLPWANPSGEWTDNEDRLAANWLQHQGVYVSVETAGQAVQTVATERRFHPVREYLDSLRWDGTKRIDTWMSRYLDSEVSDYTSAVGACWLISAVARIYQPGAKADCCLILEGPQGIKKSTALKTIAEPWFTDEIADLGSKDAAMQTRGVWIIEIAELDSLSRSEVSKIKAFMSRTTDRFRPPYGKRLVESPRQCVFAGSVNHSTYLRDETGGRRFWPVTCSGILIDDLAHDRDQLWAEAVHQFREGAVWWLNTRELTRAAELEQSDRYEGDPWDELVTKWVERPAARYDTTGHPIEPFTSDRESVTITDVLTHCIGKRQDQWTQGDKNRIARSLGALGFVRYKAGPRGAREWRYRRVSQ